MGERHSIVVYVRAGEVQRVAFCDCCPPLSVEVRTYEGDPPAPPVPGEPVMRIFPERMSEEYWRDHEGIYRVVLYEPEDE